MEETKVHIRLVMLWKPKNNKNAKETAKKMYRFYGLGVIYWSPSSKLLF